tara:strand:+ start:227 stop:523 length:297 start_codon:yes stop_codon:yes gene_type:complete
MKNLKIIFVLLSLILLSGCFQSTALIGPGVTLASSGNVFQAGMQIGANTAIKKETGKDAYNYIKDSVEEKNNKKKFNKEFRQLVENRIKNTRKKLFLN